MACAQPILLLVDGEAREILEVAGAGLFVPPGEPQALASAIRRMADMDVDQLGAMGFAAVDFAGGTVCGTRRRSGSGSCSRRWYRAGVCRSRLGAQSESSPHTVWSQLLTGTGTAHLLIVSLIALPMFSPSGSERRCANRAWVAST